MLVKKLEDSQECTLGIHECYLIFNLPLTPYAVSYAVSYTVSYTVSYAVSYAIRSKGPRRLNKAQEGSRSPKKALEGSGSPRKLHISTSRFQTQEDSRRFQKAP